jgi:hypothetical protein
MLLDDDEHIVEPPIKKVMPDSALVTSTKNPTAFKRVGGDGIAKLKALKFQTGQVAAPIGGSLSMPKLTSPASQLSIVPVVNIAAPSSPPVNRSVVDNDVPSPQPAAPPSPLLQSSCVEASRSVVSSEAASSPAAPVEAPKKKMVQATLASFFTKKSPSSTA